MATTMLQITLHGLLALAQPPATDQGGMLVLVPRHSHHPPVHTLYIETTQKTKSEVRPGWIGPAPSVSTQGKSIVWLIPEGYEVAILDGSGKELPVKQITVDADVKVPSVGDASLLQSTRLLDSTVETKHLEPIKNKIPVAAALAARLRLRSGKLRAWALAAVEHPKVKLSYTSSGGSTKEYETRAAGAALYEQSFQGSHVDLQFRALDGSKNGGVLRFNSYKFDGDSKVDLSFAYEADVHAFCELVGDAAKLEHSTYAFSLLGVSPLSVATLNYNSDQMDKALDKACEATLSSTPKCPVTGCQAGKKPAICYTILMPSPTISW